MFLNFQHSDHFCLPIFNSNESAPPCVGVSVVPPFKKSRDHAKLKLNTLNARKTHNKSCFLGNPYGGIEENNGFGGSLRSEGGGNRNRGEGEMVEEELYKGGFLGKRDAGVQGDGKFDSNSTSRGGFNRAEKAGARTSRDNGGKNGVLNRVKAAENGVFKRCDERIENDGKDKEGVRLMGGKEKMQTKCSTKWRRYGGCIPAMLEALATVNDLDEALKPWEVNLTNKERSIILKEQLQWERAVEIFEWFKLKGSYEVNVIHYNIMLRALGKAGQWCQIERLLREMSERSIKPINSTYGTLIDVYSKGGLREEAIKWLELMQERGIELDEVTMGTVVQMYKKAGDFKTAEEFFKNWSFKKRSVEVPRGVPLRSELGHDSSPKANTYVTAYSYNNLIDTYGKAGKLQEANETFEFMIKENIVPTTVTFNTMLHMYGNNGQLCEVASLMQKMEEVHCSPDTRTYNVLISVFAKHDNIEKASGYLKRMKEASLEPDSVTYRTLLYAFAIRHMVAEAEELISEMDERALEIDEFTQSALTRMYIEAGMLECSWSWFLRFHVQGKMSSECYSANIDAFGERGHIRVAEKVFNCCLEKGRLNVLEFNVMIKAYSISKKLDLACCLFDSMYKHSVIPDSCTYNSLIQMLAGSDLPEKAMHYLRKMQEDGLVIDCVPYCAVISSYAKLHQLEKAVALYDEMIGCGVKPDVVLYGVLINAFADAGSVKEAANYVDTMKDMGFPMNDIICKSLIKLYTKVGYLKEAQETYMILQPFLAGIDLFSSNCMIDLYSERSMISEAEEIFKNLMQHGVANEFTYAMMLRMYKRNGRFVEALHVARKMRELGLITNLLSYNSVLGLYASDGRFKEAAATFNEMLKSNTLPDDSTFKSLRIVLLKCGVPASALDKLELARKKDALTGLQAWTSTLSAFIGMN